MMRYLDPEHTMIRTPDGGLIWAKPASEYYLRLVREGVYIAPWKPPAPTADDVRREASRRMQQMVGARSADHLDVVISNGTREAVRLLRKGSANWSPEEAARAAALEMLDAAIEALRAASNRMEPSPPQDYTADMHWE